MNLLLIGCGKLGKILLSSWVASKSFKKIIIVQPSLSEEQNFKNIPDIHFVRSIYEIPSDIEFHITVLAIKPQIAHDVIPQLSSYISESIIISLLAGVNIDKLTSYLGKSIKVIRLMPNTALLVKQSTNLVFANNNVSIQDSECINQLFDLLGKIIWLSKEKHLDILTPISGSGPAYFFLLAEILTQITIKQGIDEKLAREIIGQTFLGSAMLAYSGEKYETLINDVASKEGVTEAALNVLKPLMPEIMDKALEAAFEKLKELSL